MLLLLLLFASSPLNSFITIIFTFRTCKFTHTQPYFVSFNSFVQFFLSFCVSLSLSASYVFHVIRSLNAIYSAIGFVFFDKELCIFAGVRRWIQFFGPNLKRWRWLMRYTTGRYDGRHWFSEHAIIATAAARLFAIARFWYVWWHLVDICTESENVRIVGLQQIFLII